MALSSPVSTLSEKCADIFRWFDDSVYSIRVEEIKIVSGIALKEKQDRGPLLKNPGRGAKFQD